MRRLTRRLLVLLTVVAVAIITRGWRQTQRMATANATTVLVRDVSLRDSDSAIPVLANARDAATLGNRPV